MSYINASVLSVDVYVDKYIRNDIELLFVSCFKGAESVKGALAGFLSNSDFLIDKKYYRRSSHNYKMTTQKITDGVTYGMTYVESMFSGENVSKITVVFGDTGEEVKDMLYARLRKFSQVPLLESWRDVILKNCVEPVRLESFGIKFAYEVALPADKELESFVISNLETLKQLERR